MNFDDRFIQGGRIPEPLQAISFGPVTLLHHNSTEIDERSPPIKLSGAGVERGAYKLPTTCHGLIVTPILNGVEYLDCESLIGNAKVFVILSTHA